MTGHNFSLQNARSEKEKQFEGYRSGLHPKQRVPFPIIVEEGIADMSEKIKEKILILGVRLRTRNGSKYSTVNIRL